MRGYLIYTGVSLLVAAANCHAQPSFYLRQCGDYEVNARVSCDQGSCTLTVVPGSQGQTVLQLKTTPLVYPQYANSFIHARVRISSLSGRTGSGRGPGFDPTKNRSSMVDCRSASRSSQESVLREKVATRTPVTPEYVSPGKKHGHSLRWRRPAKHAEEYLQQSFTDLAGALNTNGWDVNPLFDGDNSTLHELLDSGPELES